MHMQIDQTRKNGAFTMIELLAAITILMVIVSIMSVIFAESERAWTQGTNMVERNTEARAALNLLGHDLQYAVADDIFTFAMRNDRAGLETYGFLNTEICFISLVQDAKKESEEEDEAGNEVLRSTKQIYYYVEERTINDSGSEGLGRYQLMRTAINTYEGNAYENRFWYNSSRGEFDKTAIISENVTAFGVCAVNVDEMSTKRKTYGNGYPEPQYLSSLHGDRLPQYIDIYLEILGEKDAIRAARLKQDLGENDPKILEFIEKNSRRYTSRVYFQNRAGYRNRT